MAHLLVILPDADEPLVFSLEEKFTTIGRAPGNTIVIGEGAASRKHLMIKAMNESYRLVDLGSANGTVVNGERLPSKKELDLAHDDRIQIGKTVLVFKEQ
ncbi:MAG: FHA domain-containing protein [Planctomycetes bacterium]|nr:FHA domain-containing protein [Planctomycetota bacterium]